MKKKKQNSFRSLIINKDTTSFRFCTSSLTKQQTQIKTTNKEANLRKSSSLTSNTSQRERKSLEVKQQGRISEVFIINSNQANKNISKKSKSQNIIIIDHYQTFKEERKYRNTRSEQSSSSSALSLQGAPPSHHISLLLFSTQKNAKGIVSFPQTFAASHT